MKVLTSNLYSTLWNDSVLQKRIEQGIEANRKSDAEIQIRAFDGKPLPGIKVEVEQYTSSFHFGANIFKLNDYSDEVLNRNYEKAFVGLLNAATVPFYWRTLEPEEGHLRFDAHSMPFSRRPPPDQAVRFCKENGLRMHGHTLVWNMRQWSIPDWLPDDPQVAEPFWEKRIREIAQRYGDDIHRWDVLNEATATHYGILGQKMLPDYELKAFKLAEKYFPSGTRFDINETTNSWNLASPDYTSLIERLTDEGLPLGGIGMQFHLFSDEELLDVSNGRAHTPEALLEALDHYSKFNLPIHISEITLPSPGNTTESLEAQALVARNLYRLWFSHSSVEGISWWNFPDGGAVYGEDKLCSGLLFENLQPKPAYDALRDLLHDEWRTKFTGTTDDDGNVQFRGFHGVHRISTALNTQSTITLEPGKSANKLIYI
ncbi:endo-1,4-beta-xylanase [Rubellicoccus peritrichatus]|uniref:Beta-xylanase n=1 Tax=Rubellicoccus peritrichatus TaxID=3080537 RepID=A0AAQ3LFG9_9BACT|nr:endo-1,4-beta-xylanase [Puniceicoccus sp. CR14]WOO43599.1 endo-1,4-beta-xylanase [Puniceicoccus sp. CR14]